LRPGRIADRLERLHDAELKVVVHREIALGRPGVLPGEDEHRMPTLDQVLHQRVRRREIQDVVLHDPGRHDEQRLGMHLGRARRVLDELDQAVAQHHAPRRKRYAFSGQKILRPRGRLAHQRAAQVFGEVRRAVHEIGSRLFAGRLQHLGIGPGEIRRRPEVEELASGEVDDVLVVRRHAMHASRRVVPPLLQEEKALLDGLEGPFLPPGRHKAPVLRQRLNRLARDIAQPLARRLALQLDQLARRGGEVQPPVAESERERGRRNAERGARRVGAREPVGLEREHSGRVELVVLGGRERGQL